MINSYKIQLHADGDKIQIPAAVGKKISKADMAEIVTLKSEIMAELIARKNAQTAKFKAIRATWAEQRAIQDAEDAPLLADMETRANELRSQIPADHIEVIATQTGDMDGDPIMQYTANGEIVGWNDITVIGWASAIRPGAMGAFASIQVCSINKDKLEQIKSSKIAAEKAKAAAKKAETDRIANIFEVAKKTGKKQEIKHYMADCNDPHEECSLDVVTVYAMPDGTEKTERMHTW